MLKKNMKEAMEYFVLFPYPQNSTMFTREVWIAGKYMRSVRRIIQVNHGYVFIKLLKKLDYCFTEANVHWVEKLMITTMAVVYLPKQQYIHNRYWKHDGQMKWMANYYKWKENEGLVKSVSVNCEIGKNARALYIADCIWNLMGYWANTTLFQIGYMMKIYGEIYWKQDDWTQSIQWLCWWFLSEFINLMYKCIFLLADNCQYLKCLVHLSSTC